MNEESGKERRLGKYSTLTGKLEELRRE